MTVYQEHKSRSRENLTHITTLTLTVSCTCEAYKFAKITANANGEKTCEHTKDELLALAAQIQELAGRII